MQPDPGLEDEVRKADRADVDTLARILARAFDDDPLTTWMFPDHRPAQRLPRMFRALLREALPLQEVYTVDKRRAAASMEPAGHLPRSLGWRANARMGLTMALLMRHRLLGRASGLLYFDRHHPEEPHWYLQMLGTEPEWQGKGIGSSLLAPILDRCDRTGEHVYLEASKEKNVPFYARHGFVVTEEMHLPKGPTMWAMWRDPAVSPSAPPLYPRKPWRLGCRRRRRDTASITGAQGRGGR